MDKVWARVGRFCDITEWMNSPEWENCKYLQGDGGPGTVRSIVNEVLVGQTQYSYQIPGDLGRLPQDVELALFRVFQESLTNVHRHSASKTAHVRLAVEHHKAVLEFKDLGQGIPSHVLELNSESLATLGVGIRGMDERLRQLGGQLETFSSPEGTTVGASIPLREP